MSPSTSHRHAAAASPRAPAGRAAYLLALVLLVACQTTPAPPPPPGKLWIVSVTKDPFTDVVTRIATIGAFRGTTYTQTGQLYPFVGVKEGRTYVGIRSGGAFRVPTGTVQLRIDENPAWTITPEETPADFVPSTIPPPGGTPELQAGLMINMAKILSPYTAATGKKAADIIKQMAQGKVIRYRTIGLNQAASTTGEVNIDSSFVEAVRGLGIDLGAQ